MKLKEIIKNGFDEIIQYHIDKGELHSRAVVNVFNIFVMFCLVLAKNTEGVA